MNIGIYVQNLADHEQIREIADAINTSIETQLVKDASIFYENIGYTPFNIKCGIFNSTDIWNFSGKLIVTSLNVAMSSVKIVNNIDIFYYYGLETKISPLSLIYLLQNNVKFIARTENDSKDLYRKTGKAPEYTANTFTDLINKLGDV